ncbi:MAG TPA: IPT/TIG domain-containing protein [Longimicrobium sp.]|jgi:hypothetical protein|uniref:IPT/TIG domain-containing protein n=1 Tax=Longimicrobium sp. TaxID=2029185 RepID=UPI002ED9AEE5
MTEQGQGPEQLEVHAYTLEAVGGAAPAALAVEDAATMAPMLPLRIVLRGSGFRIGALDPVIRVGDVVVRRFEISSDQRTIVGYVDEVPPEGAEISVEYPSRGRAVLPEPFTISKLGGAPPVA